MTIACRITLALALCLATSCAPGISASRGPAPVAIPAGSAETPPAVNAIWPVRSREHVDLWLHSYALLAADTARVPYYTRGYRDRMLALRRQRGVSTLLDTNRGRLLQRIALNPALGTNPQFLPLYFESWDQLRLAIDLFLRSNGNPNATNDPTGRTYIAILAASFPTAPDREWARLLSESVEDESRRFYHEYWTAESRARAPVAARVDTLWQHQWRPALQRFLNNTQQQNGELYLSLPLGGEGRTVQFGKQQNAVAGPMPEHRDGVDAVLYVMAHEITGAVATGAIEDNTTPADRRSGITARYEQAAAVRAGALLLERAVPAVVPGYMRYYLLQAGRPAPTDPRAAFLAAFAVPEAVMTALERQLDVILGGI